MICYQDEKIYGPPQDDITMDEIEAQIAQLEMKIYGHRLPDDCNVLKHQPMIFDTELGILVERTKEYDEEVKRRFADWNGEDEQIF